MDILATYATMWPPSPRASHAASVEPGQLGRDDRLVCGGGRGPEQRPAQRCALGLSGLGSAAVLSYGYVLVRLALADRFQNEEAR